MLDTYFNDETALMHSLPTVQFLAEKLNISPKYLGDVLRALTGHNPQSFNKMFKLKTNLLPLYFRTSFN